MHHAQISLFWYKSMRISTYVLNLTGSLDPWIPLVIHEKVEFCASCTNITLLIHIYKNWYLRLKFDWILGSLDPTNIHKGWILYIMHKYHSFDTNLWELVPTSQIGLDPWILLLYGKIEFHASCTNITLSIQIYEN